MIDSRACTSALCHVPSARASCASQPTACSASGPRGESAPRIALATRGATGCSAKNPPMPHMLLEPLRERESGSVALKPLLQHEQRPKAAGVARPRPLEQRAQCVRAEKPALAQPLAGESALDVRLEEAGEPLRERRHETLLAAMDDVHGQEFLGELLEHELAGSAPLLERGIQPRAELEEAVIEIWHARLERMGHGGAIDLGEEIVGEPEARIHVHQLVDVLARVALPVVALGEVG